MNFSTQTFRTTAKGNTFSPCWNERFRLRGPILLTARLHFPFAIGDFETENIFFCWFYPVTTKAVVSCALLGDRGALAWPAEVRYYKENRQKRLLGVRICIYLTPVWRFSKVGGWVWSTGPLPPGFGVCRGSIQAGWMPGWLNSEEFLDDFGWFWAGCVGLWCVGGCTPPPQGVGFGWVGFPKK